MYRAALVALLLAAAALAQEPVPAGAAARVGSPRLRHQVAVCALAYSDDGKLLASATTDRRVTIFDAATGLQRRQFMVPSPSVALPNNNMRLMNNVWDADPAAF